MKGTSSAIIRGAAINSVVVFVGRPHLMGKADEKRTVTPSQSACTLCSVCFVALSL